MATSVAKEKMPTLISQKSNKRRLRKGITIIELMIVITIIGSVLTLVYQMINSLLVSEAEGISSMGLSTITTNAREYALMNGEIVTLEFNQEERTMSLRTHLRQLESHFETELSRDEIKEQYADEIEWLFEDIDFPSDLKSFYSISGIKLTTPYIFMHFYPNGSSDSIILFFEGREKPYYYIPRFDANGIYFTELKETGYE